ncbi:unnamed protein product [Closterium sp. Naga37s-1]|nr:unnamed protein product [Closterium sp. Naga37s-1]
MSSSRLIFAITTSPCRFPFSHTLPPLPPLPFLLTPNFPFRSSPHSPPFLSNPPFTSCPLHFSGLPPPHPLFLQIRISSSPFRPSSPAPPSAHHPRPTHAFPPSNPLPPSLPTHHTPPSPHLPPIPLPPVFPQIPRPFSAFRASSPSDPPLDPTLISSLALRYEQRRAVSCVMLWNGANKSWGVEWSNQPLDPTLISSLALRYEQRPRALPLFTPLSLSSPTLPLFTTLYPSSPLSSPLSPFTSPETIRGSAPAPGRAASKAGAEGDNAAAPADPNSFKLALQYVKAFPCREERRTDFVLVSCSGAGVPEERRETVVKAKWAPAGGADGSEGSGLVWCSTTGIELPRASAVLTSLPSPLTPPCLTHRPPQHTHIRASAVLTSLPHPSPLLALPIVPQTRTHQGISCADVADVCVKALHDPTARNKSFDVAHLPDRANNYLTPALAQLEKNT